MTYTLEARWFGTPPLPAALRDWFDTLASPKTSTRTDLYLPAADPTLNLKLRGDQVQVKRRLAGPIRTSFGPKAAGCCEQWAKWSFRLSEEESLPGDEEPTDQWIPVEKTRHQFAIPAGDQSALTSTLPTSPPATIEAELTEVEADAATAWTLCVETKGPVSSLVDTLTTAAPLLLDDQLPVSLSTDQSFGYIRWLQQLPAVSTRPAPEVQISRPEE